jgi:glycosyltransferase involved in cell wall biosynthesis
MWSVIIPTLLRNKLIINKLLDEIILISKFIDTEIILIIDATAKNKKFEIKEKYNKYLRVIYSDKKGPGLLRNCGLKYANGDYISFFDDDDQLLFNNKIVEFKSDIVIFEFIHPSEVFSNKIILEYIKLENLYNTKKICLKACELEYIFSYCQPFAIKRSILNLGNIQFFDSYIMEDFDFNSQIFSGEYTVSVCDEIKYKYIFHPKSTKTLVGPSIYNSSCKVTDRIKERINNSKSIKYTKMEYEYAVNIRRFRYIETLDYQYSYSYQYTHTESEDCIYFKNLIKMTKESEYPIIIYCYNNTSINLYKILNKKDNYIVDDNVQIKDQNGINVIVTEEFMDKHRVDLNLQIFIAHAHPKVKDKVINLFKKNGYNIKILNQKVLLN